MKVSIVTISFNQRQFLEQALDSVLSQHFPELEYIVVDPGSTDGSRELIESYANRIAVRLLEPDRGAADGLKKGFGHATGKIFGFLNSDDFLFPGSLAAINAYFTSRPDVDILLGDGFVTDGGGNPVRHVRARAFTPRHYVFGGLRWLQQATFFRAEAYRQAGGINLENKTCWDGELLVDMLLGGAHMDVLHRDLAAFRIHAASITGSQRLEEAYALDQQRIYRKILGRGPVPGDRLRRAWYKGRTLAADPRELADAVRTRIKGRPQ